MILLTLSVVNSLISPLNSPSKPLYIALTFILLHIALRVTALIAAFIPGESPPDVNIPIQLILGIIINKNPLN